jgi:hypothetical protein
MRQSARADAVAFHVAEVQAGTQEPSLDRVKELMLTMESWVE